MKLYHSGGTSLMSCAVTAGELGIKCELIKVRWWSSLQIGVNAFPNVERYLNQATKGVGVKSALDRQ